MATQIPAPSAKRQRRVERAKQGESDALAAQGLINPSTRSVLVQFQSGQDDSYLGTTLSLPAAAGQREMEQLVNTLRKQLKPRGAEDEDEDEEDVPYTFHVSVTPPSAGGEEAASTTPTRININNSLQEDVLNTDVAKKLGISEESSLTVVFEPQAVFRVRAVHRCTSTLSGHASPILCCSFSPSGQLLATGAGDKTCRLWDMDSETPLHTLTGHAGWVLCAEWEPRERQLATGGMDGQVWIWDALDPRRTGRRGWGSRTGQQVDEQLAPEGRKLSVSERRAARHAAPPGRMLRGHTKWVTSLAWEPVHRNAQSPRLASSSKDGTVRVWNVASRGIDFVLGGHSASVNAVRWGGDGAIYTASSDRTVKVWNDQDGRLIRSLQDHAHWVNTLALSTDYVLRTGPYDPRGKYQSEMEARLRAGASEDEEAKHAGEAAQERYSEATSSGQRPELLVSGSDDHTLFLWPPQTAGQEKEHPPKKPLARLTGHQKTVNHVCFSPDGRMIASASFDNSIKLWDARTGKFIANLRGHVAAVYRVAWSSDSRMLVSASRDSTLKLWNLETFKIRVDLPGHEDEVYCVDFIADKVASGGRDRKLKIWRN